MAIERRNKFGEAVQELNANEDIAIEKSEKVVESITGKRKRRNEERKVLPTYIPMSLYQEFDEITSAYGISHNAAICQLIRDYVTEKRRFFGK